MPGADWALPLVPHWYIWANIDILQSIVTERLVSFVLAFAAVIIVSLMNPSKKMIEKE